MAGPDTSRILGLKIGEIWDFPWFSRLFRSKHREKSGKSQLFPTFLVFSKFASKILKDPDGHPDLSRPWLMQCNALCFVLSLIVHLLFCVFTLEFVYIELFCLASPHKVLKWCSNQSWWYNYSDSSSDKARFEKLKLSMGSKKARFTSIFFADSWWLHLHK